MINIDWTLLLQFGNFLLLLLVLNALLYRPLRAILAQRKATVDGDYDRAKALEESINDKMTRYQEQLKAAKDKGAQERGELRQAAQTEEAKVLQAAHAGANEKLERIRAQVAVEAEGARSALKSEANNLAGLVAAKVLGRSL